MMTYKGNMKSNTVYINENGCSVWLGTATSWIMPWYAWGKSSTVPPAGFLIFGVTC